MSKKLLYILIFISINYTLSAQLDLLINRDTSKNTNVSVIKPLVSVDQNNLEAIIPVREHKITSTSSHPLGLKLFHSWEVLGRQKISDIKLTYIPQTNFVLIDVNRAGKYQIKLRVRDENKGKDSIVFTFNCVEQSLAGLLGPKPTSTTQSTIQPPIQAPAPGTPIVSVTPIQVTRNFEPIARIKNAVLTFNSLPFNIESAAVDPEGGQIFYEWKKEYGGNITYTGANSPRLAINSAENGLYGFTLKVRDDNGSEDNYTFTVSFSGTSVASTEIKQVEDKPDEKEIAEKKQPPLKGGPENALVSMVLPGVGHYLASGDYTAFDRKKYHFVTTGVYIGLLGAAAYYKVRSEISYDKYLMGEFEYQVNELGVKTDGIRGGKESELNPIYTQAKNQHRNSLYFFYAALGIAAIDATLTLAEGIKNKREYNNRWKKATGSLIFKAEDGLVGLAYKLKF